MNTVGGGLYGKQYTSGDFLKQCVNEYYVYMVLRGPGWLEGGIRQAWGNIPGEDEGGIY